MILILTLLLFNSLDPVSQCDHFVASSARADSADAARILIVPFAASIDSAAHRYGLPSALVAAVIQEESRFDPWATRVEPGYINSKRVRRAAAIWTRSHAGNPNVLTEHNDRSRSFGLMQVMGEVAREQGYTGQYLAQLYLPHESIDQGARLLRRLLSRYRNDTLAAISAYNQGSARRRRGIFLNARYVYRVAAAWHFYQPLFAAHQ